MKKYSKFAARTLSLLLAVVLLISPLALGMNANAANGDTVLKKGVTTASCLLVRTGPGTNYRLVSGLLRGSSVEILEEKDGWYKINDGWINAAYVKVEGSTPSTPAVTPTPTITPTPVPETKVGNATVTASLLFIRKDPSTNYSAIGMLRKGDRIEVLETSGNWMRIKDGWVYAAYVAKDDGTTSYDNERTNVIVTVNGLNIRSGPGTNYKTVGTLWYGEKVIILENKGEWLRINSGWVKASYIKVGG